MLSSRAAFVDRRPDFSIRQSGFRSASDLLLQLSQTFDAAADVVVALGAFRNEASDRLVVAGNDYFFSSRDALEKFSETCFCLEGGHSGHGGSPKSTSR
jgi:hypothetical protein